MSTHVYPPSVPVFRRAAPAPRSLTLLPPPDAPPADAPAVDATTGLWSAVGLERFTRATRHAGSGMGLLYLRLDGIEATRVCQGAAVADLAVREVARRVREVVRAAEAVGRVGPEALLVLLHTDSNEVARMVYSRLRTRLASRPVVLPGDDLPVTLSAGFVGVEAGTALSVDRLRAEAADAAHEAERQGGDRLETRAAPAAAPVGAR
jgi:diguanylate cyclase (GGDEF)-like protein